MEHKRIETTEIALGQPLLWDVYDSSHNLLLRKGHVVDRIQQMEALAQRGLFVLAKNVTKQEAPPPMRKERPSVLRLHDLAVKKLERVLFNIQTGTNTQAEILEVGRIIAYAADISADVALACILLNQTAGNYSVRHCIDTALISLLVARSLKKSPEKIVALTAAALSMNVGMLKHQERLQAIQGPLSEPDVRIVRTHPQLSVDLLRAAGVDNEEWLSIVLMHHENEDGSGYPSGKTSGEIPLSAKIVSIADRYCARISDRTYRKSLLPNAALRDILVAEKNNIDPALATTFIRELGIYPTGSFVRLGNGEVSVVTGKGSTSTAPIVHALTGLQGAPLSVPIKRDTSTQLYSVREVLRADQANIRFSMQQVWGEDASR